MFERQGGVSSIRKFKSVFYMIKVSLSIFFDKIRRVEYTNPLAQVGR